ncbi:RNA polymerase sigma factor SigF [Streptomyces sp. MUM 203J]|uniref:RNA polymerase sigma factor SigF n=1 Tax=Streptomyces sp. MUM 203J TaxID=2791990 RepID=UPI001F03DCCB|nr:RNA polymerase sigma factor SigF [Streptomyces sp. MUM 203J]MCH0541942.1 RNA polymerase sigma factor SigF [Streptomyces sp. MUM 203J]
MSAEQGSSKVLTLVHDDQGAQGDLAATLPAPAGAVGTAAPAALDTADAAPANAAPKGVAATAPASPAEALDTRTLSRSLFLRLRTLDAAGVAADSPERTYVRDTLIELNLPLVRYAAARFRSRNEPMEDIVQVGTIGLIKAIDRFDCERGVEFPTFAMPTVVGEIKRFFRDTSWSVRVPRRLQELRLALTKASDELAQKLDRSPTVPELASALGVSEEDVVDGLAVGNAYTASSLDSPSPEDDGGEGSLADRLGYEDSALEGVEYRESLKPLLAKLPARERQIIMLRFFANMTQSQIGEEVGISQMHVSRLLTRTLSQLREGLIAD